MSIQYILMFQPKQVDNVSFDTLFAVNSFYPSNTIFRNGRVRFVNTTAGAITIEACAVPTSGSPTDSNKILPLVSIPANSYIDLDLPFMDVGSTLQAKAGAANSITASFINGFLQS